MAERNELGVSDPHMRALELVGGICLVAAAFLLFHADAAARALAGALGVMTVASSAWLWRKLPNRRWDPTLLLGIALMVGAALSLKSPQFFVLDYFVGTLLTLSAAHARVPVAEIEEERARLGRTAAHPI